MDNDNVPHLEVRPLPPRLRPTSHLYLGLPRSERRDADRLRARIHEYTRRVEVDIRALPEYARRLLTMSGVGFETAGYHRYFSALLVGEYRADEGGIYHRRERRISLPATYRGAPDSVRTDTAVAHEAGHALAHSPVILGMLQSDLDRWPLIRAAYARDLAALPADARREYGMDLEHYLPASHAARGHAPILARDPLWIPRAEAVAEAWEIVVRGGSPADDTWPDYSRTFRRMFPHTVAVMERIHRETHGPQSGSSGEGRFSGCFGGVFQEIVAGIAIRGRHAGFRGSGVATTVSALHVRLFGALKLTLKGEPANSNSTRRAGHWFGPAV